jgi:hypothetical protein
MEHIWNEFVERGVDLSTRDYEARLYQGVKMVKDEDGFHMLSTESDFYVKVGNDIITIFLEQGFDEGVRAYKRDKYLRQIRDFGGSKYVTSALTKKLENL